MDVFCACLWFVCVCVCACRCHTLSRRKVSIKLGVAKATTYLKVSCVHVCVRACSTACCFVPRLVGQSPGKLVLGSDSRTRARHRNRRTPVGLDAQLGDEGFETALYANTDCISLQVQTAKKVSELDWSEQSLQLGSPKLCWSRRR